MVDSGATSHILTCEDDFISFDDSFQPHEHFVELADGSKHSGIAVKRGDAIIQLVTTEGKTVKTTLKESPF